MTRIMFQFIARSARNDRGRRKAARMSRPLFEVMEGRQLLSTLPAVTNTNDSGPGSLRAAIIELDKDSNTTPDTITINIDAPTLSQARIALQSPLPAIFRPVTIDASNLALFGKNGVGLELDATTPQASAEPGLQIYASDVTVRGVAFDGFSGGVVVDGNNESGAANVVLDHDFFGLNNADNAYGNAQFGVRFQNGANHDTLSNSIVSANHGDGVDVTSGSNYITLDQDTIGSDNMGLARVDDRGGALGNSGYGVSVTDGASYVTLDGPAQSVLSTVSNNGIAGIYFGPGTTNNQVVNYTIDANGQSGVELDGSSYDTLTGDMIGVNASGQSGSDLNGNSLGNAGSGVWVHDGAVSDHIGSPTSGGNVISGNHQWGIYVSDASTYFTTIQDNEIGTDVTGESAIPNAYNGVDVVNTAPYTTVDDNVISGNAYTGLVLYSADATVQGNLIGIDRNGTKALPNGADGVYIGAGAYGNLVGGTSTSDRNVISGNGGHGVTDTNSGTNSNTIQGDYIGTNAQGTRAVANHDGVLILGGATYTTVSNDVISGNLSDGVYISDSGTSFNHVFNCLIGTDQSGENALGNGAYGVAIVNGATWDYVGLDFSMNPSRDVISANGWDGVYVASSGTNADYVNSNYIGTDAALSKGLGNGGNGVKVEAGASYDYFNNNVIAANQANGIQINGSNTYGEQVEDNIIGTVPGGALWLGNGGSGLVLNGTAGDVVMGNYFQYNGGWGIFSENGSSSPGANQIVNNHYYYNTQGDFAAY